MPRYSVQTRDRISVKGYGFLSFVKNINKSIGKYRRKTLSGKYSQKILDHAKQSAEDAFKSASKTGIQKRAEATSDLIGNIISYRIIKVLKNSQQDNSETVTNHYSKEMSKERYISPEERQLLMSQD